MITRWCGNNDSGRNGTGWDVVQWGTRCLGHRGAASIHIHRGGWVQDAFHLAHRSRYVTNIRPYCIDHKKKVDGTSA